MIMQRGVEHDHRWPVTDVEVGDLAVACVDLLEVWQLGLLELIDRPVGQLYAPVPAVARNVQNALTALSMPPPSRSSRLTTLRLMATQPTRRQLAATQTRERLIDTGLQLAERTPLSELSVNVLVAAADVSKGTFFHHFGDRANYLRALHNHFHERVLEEITDAIGELPPGRERLLLGARTYLDACLRHRGVRAFLLEARAERVIVEAVAARNATNAKLCTADFRAMGWPHPADCARLWIGLVAEAALVELEHGKRRPALRAAVGAFLGDRG